jgi:hypothetical protein
MNKFKKITVKSTLIISVLNTASLFDGLYQVSSTKKVIIIDTDAGNVNLKYRLNN